MSNNPGKKGKPAPWILRERADRAGALVDYIREREPEYWAEFSAWNRRRSEASEGFRQKAEAKFPAAYQMWDRLTWGDRKLREWDKKNPRPLLAEERQRELEAEFAKHYVPIDRS